MNRWDVKLTKRSRDAGKPAQLLLTFPAELAAAFLARSYDRAGLTLTAAGVVLVPYASVDGAANPPAVELPEVWSTEAAEGAAKAGKGD